MSTFDLEQSSATRTRPAARREGPGSDASTVIGLQRLAGNSAVAGAIRSGQIGADHGQLDIQRLVDDEGYDDDYDEDTTDETETDEDLSDLTDEDLSDLTDEDLGDVTGEEESTEDEGEDEESA